MRLGIDPEPNSQAEKRKAVYVRSAYRNDPEFQIQNLPRIAPAVDQSRFARLIDNDQVVMQNYQRLVSQGFQEIFEGIDPNVTLGEFREQLIGKIRDAMQRLFPGLVLNSLGNPLSEGTFKFNKGDEERMGLVTDIYVLANALRNRHDDNLKVYVDVLRGEQHEGVFPAGYMRGIVGLYQDETTTRSYASDVHWKK